MKSWTITWDEFTWTDEVASAGLAVGVCELLEVPNPPSPWDGLSALSAWIILLLTATRPHAGTVEERREAAMLEVYGAPMSKVTTALTERDPDLPVPPIVATTVGDRLGFTIEANPEGAIEAFEGTGRAVAPAKRTTAKKAAPKKPAPKRKR